MKKNIEDNENIQGRLFKKRQPAFKLIQDRPKWFLSQRSSKTTIESNPDAAAELVKKLKALQKEREDRPSEPPKGGVFDSGLREDIESNLGKTDIEDAHQTQVYPDNYRVSRTGDGPWHWTNQNIRDKNNPDRHRPPEDIKK